MSEVSQRKVPNTSIHKSSDDQERQRVWLEGLLAQAQQRKFYGKLIITMEEGVIRRVVKEESLKPPT